MTQFGIGTYAYAWAIGVAGYPAPQQPMTLTDFIERAAQLGVSRVQIADNLPLHTLDENALSALINLTEQHGIAVEVGTRGIAPAHLRRYLEIARRFDSPILRVVVDTADYHPDSPEIIETLRAMMPEFETAQVTLAIENHDRFKARTLADLIQQIDSPKVGICLDTVNSFGALEGPDVVIETLGQFVVNLHVKDFSIGRLPHNMGFSLTGTPAGDGMLDVPDVLRRLHSYGRDFNAILEVWTPDMGNVEANIRQENEWVEQSVQYLKRIFT
ncbi:MAG: sugar phosphate isomerase/epimerase family protein [Aggregatilineales bacterium]